MKQELAQQLIRHEGLRKTPYMCPAGFLTIGVGHNLEAKGITDAQAMAILLDDIGDAEADVRAVLGPEAQVLAEAEPVRYAVLVNMAFNLGRARLSGFRQMLGAFRRRDWGACADEMRDSKWARQVGRRAQELADQMRTGQWRGGAA